MPCLAYHGFNLFSGNVSSLINSLDIVPDGGFAIRIMTNSSNYQYLHRFELKDPYSVTLATDAFDFLRCSKGTLLPAGFVRYKSYPNTGWTGGVVINGFMSCSNIISASGDLPNPYCK